MPWFNVDDGFANSKPVMRIPRRYRAVCIGVWTLCGSWSAKELTDGFIPQEVAAEYGATAKVIEYLILSGLWEHAEHEKVTGVRFRNWAKWQKTKQQVLDYRTAEADRKRNRRNANKAGPDQQQQNVSAECPTGTHNGHPPGHHAESGIPIPKPEPLPKPLVVTTGGEQTSVAARVGEPPRFCPRHMPSGTLENCGPCKQTRRDRETWMANQSQETQRAIETRAAQLRVERQTAAATRQDTINACTLCDETGYRNGIVCDHIDRTSTARAGMAAVRAALGTPHDLDEEIEP